MATEKLTLAARDWLERVANGNYGAQALALIDAQAATLERVRALAEQGRFNAIVEALGPAPAQATWVEDRSQGDGYIEADPAPAQAEPAFNPEYYLAACQKLEAKLEAAEARCAELEKQVLDERARRTKEYGNFTTPGQAAVLKAMAEAPEWQRGSEPGLREIVPENGYQRWQVRVCQAELARRESEPSA